MTNDATNPRSRQETPSDRPPQERSADALVIFGLTGDLGQQKLFPALAELAATDLLTGPVIGVGRSEVEPDELWARFEDAVPDGALPDRSNFDLRYLVGDSQEDETYEQIAREIGDATQPVFYAALPPSLFEGLARRIRTSSLPSGTRLVVEKPFGSNADEARRLHQQISADIGDERLFIVDHFLAKASVENLRALRAANPVLDAALHRDHVRRIEVTMAESFGVEGRGGFYDAVGALEDVVQNHVLQMLATLLVDVSELDPGADPDERSDVMTAIRPIDPDRAVFGQYEGYREIEDVDASSSTETFVAFSVDIDTERWRDVEVLLRTGKELAMDLTEVVVLFGASDQSGPESRLRFQIKPEAQAVIELIVLEPGGHAPGDHGFTTIELCAPVPDAHGELGDYATLLAGALTNDRRHFATIDGIVAAWRVVEPLRNAPPTLHSYERQTMGPAAADRLAGVDGWAGPTSG